MNICKSPFIFFQFMYVYVNSYLFGFATFDCESSHGVVSLLIFIQKFDAQLTILYLTLQIIWPILITLPLQKPRNQIQYNGICNTLLKLQIHFKQVRDETGQTRNWLKCAETFSNCSICTAVPEEQRPPTIQGNIFSFDSH